MQLILPIRAGGLEREGGISCNTEPRKSPLLDRLPSTALQELRHHSGRDAHLPPPYIGAGREPVNHSCAPLRAAPAGLDTRLHKDGGRSSHAIGEREVGGWRTGTPPTHPVPSWCLGSAWTHHPSPILPPSLPDLQPDHFHCGKEMKQRGLLNCSDVYWEKTVGWREGAQNLRSTCAGSHATVIWCLGMNSGGFSQHFGLGTLHGPLPLPEHLSVNKSRFRTRVTPRNKCKVWKAP